VITYQYRCPGCGDVDVRCPMGEAASHVGCPHCGEAARRVFTSPRTPLLAPGVGTAIDAAGASAENPAVVSTPPRAPGVPRPAHPLHARLPRP
jgi:putative FmdB family regulatory protein